MAITIIVSLGIGGLFINGTFLNVVILSWLPQIVHTIVGWAVIGLTLVGVVMKAK